jgi:hypothetical protein
MAVFSAESCTAPRGVSHGADDLVQLPVLGQAGNRARLIEGVDLLALRGGREDDNGRRWAGLADRYGRLHPVELGQAIVEKDDIGPEPRAHVERAPPVRNGGDDPQIGHGPEQELERLAKDVVVLNEDDGDGLACHVAQNIGLLGAEQEGIVRLAALVNLDLNLRMQLLDECNQVVHALRALAGQDREHVGALLEE